MHLQAGDVQSATEIPSSSSKIGSYVARHWRGEVSPPKSFWINGVGILLAQMMLARVVAVSVMSKEYNPSSMAVLIIIFVLLRYSVGTWQIVGIWRSARTGRRFWTLVTKLVCLIVVAVFFYVDSTITMPVLFSAVTMVDGDKAMGPHVIRLLPGGREVEFAGAITWGSAGELRKVLEDHPEIRVVHLNSQGGRMGEAEIIRGLIREHGLTTYTSGSCSSSCTLAFLGGRERWIAEGARLGFHRGNIPGASWIVDSKMAQQMSESYHQAGLNDTFIRQVMEVSPADVWFPPPAHLVYVGVITGVAAPGWFAPSGFLMNVAMKKAVPYASGPLLDAFTRTFIEIFEAIEQADPEACQRFFNRNTVYSVELAKYMSAELRARNLNATKQIVEAREFTFNQVKAPPEKSAVEPIYPVLEEAMRSRGTDPAAVKAVLTDQSRNREHMCWATIEYYKAAMVLPDDKRELFLKYNLTQD